MFTFEIVQQNISVFVLEEFRNEDKLTVWCVVIIFIIFTWKMFYDAAQFHHYP